VIDVQWLVRDEWNLTHIWERHGLRPEPVEAACFGDPIALSSYKGRIVLIGPDHGERILTVVLGVVPGQPGSYYTFSARPASRKERRFYFEQKGHGES